MYTDEELNRMFGERDLDSNGEITFDEFKIGVLEKKVRGSEGHESCSLAKLAKLAKLNGGRSMKWREDRKGPGIEVDGDIVKRPGNQTGWGVQLADLFFNSANLVNSASVLLHIVSMEGEAFVGVVSSNYQSLNWEDSFDANNQHAVAVRFSDGNVFREGRNLELNAKLCRIEEGHFVRIDCDMQDQVMTMQVLDKNAKQMAEVSVDELPVEVCVAVAFGPSSKSEQCIKLVGSSTAKNPGKVRKSYGHDTWDEENNQTLGESGMGGLF